MRSLLSLVAVAALCAPLSAAEDLLLVGDAAPALEHVEWLAGEPAAFGDGKVYVLDFWATWCGPCRASIPHLNELSNSYADRGVQVVGVAIWPRPGMVPTADFVEEKGADMSYSIAEATGGEVADAFMKGTMSNGIPTAMIVDQGGRLAWVGHPMAGLDAALEQVVAGEWDRDAFAATFNPDVERKAKLQPVLMAFREAEAAEDAERMTELAEDVLAIDPDLIGIVGVDTYLAHVELGHAEAATAWGRRLLSDDHGRDVRVSVGNTLAWTIVAPDGPLAASERDLDLALHAASIANEFTDGRNPNVLDTLARVHFVRGDVERAIEVQQSALDLVPAQYAEMRDALGATLAEYQAAR